MNNKNLTKIYDLDGMEADFVEDVLEENKKRFKTFPLKDDLFEIEIYCKRSVVEKLLEKAGMKI